MKCSVLILLSACLTAAPQTSRTTHYDGMGQPMPSPSTVTTSTGGVVSMTEIRQSVNGRNVPIEKTEERVVRDDAGGRVVERTVRRYDPTGNPLVPERILIEESKAVAGRSTIRTTVYRGDMNGNMSLAERTVSERQTSGNTTTVRESVERPSINSGVELAERRSTDIQTNGDSESKSTVVYRRNDNGQFYEVLKQVSEAKGAAGQRTESEATYEASMSGMRLVGQTVRRLMKAPDGTEQVVEDLYTTNSPGIVNISGEAKPQLRQQQVTYRRPTANGVTETVDVRRASVTDPNRLGAQVRLSETVCTGKCK